MKISLDLSFVKTVIELWRASTDMQIPIHDSLKLHLLQNRRQILDNFKTTANAWNMLLRTAVPDAGDEVEFQETMKVIGEFHAWVERELTALEVLSVKEQVQSAVDADPTLISFLKQRPSDENA